MFDFLPEDFKTRAKHMYHGRLASLYICVMCGVFLVSLFLLLPSQMLALSKKKGLQEELSALQKSLAIKGNNTVEDFVSASKKKIEITEIKESERLFTDVLVEFLAYKTNGVSITTISFERLGTQNTMAVSGKAVSRDALLSFSKALKSNHRFESVDLPVSNLAKSKDIEFSISIKGTF
jgi:hypothetical protein